MRVTSSKDDSIRYLICTQLVLYIFFFPYIKCQVCLALSLLSDIKKAANISICYDRLLSSGFIFNAGKQPINQRGGHLGAHKRLLGLFSTKG